MQGWGLLCALAPSTGQWFSFHRGLHHVKTQCSDTEHGDAPQREDSVRSPTRTPVRPLLRIRLCIFIYNYTIQRAEARGVERRTTCPFILPPLWAAREAELVHEVRRTFVNAFWGCTVGHSLGPPSHPLNEIIARALRTFS